MLRGTSKQIIHLKNPESNLFEEAFLIVKTPPHPESSRRTMVEEANRLLEEHPAAPAQTDGSRPAGVWRALRWVLLYLTGALTGAMITVLCLL